MRRILCLFIMIAVLPGLLVGCSGLSEPTGVSSFDTGKIGPDFLLANQQFAFDIFRQLSEEDSDQSIFISPLSISTALSMVYQGAGTTTREAMEQTLRYDEIGLEGVNEGYVNLLSYLKQADKKIKLNISNSIWIREGLDVRNEFITANKNVFSAQAASLDFSKATAADEINRWISEATKGKIDKMIDPPISQDVIMYLINAIYFKGQWTEKFKTERTFESEFHAADGSIDKVMMMSRNGKVEYGTGEGYKAVRLPYGNEKTAMYILLPDENIPLDQFIEKLQPEEWNKIKDSLAETEEVILQMPRFKLEYGIKELNGTLTDLGMGEAFSNQADFSGICESTQASISRVLHKAVIEVNEEGSEAAGVTVVEMKATGAMEPITFVADRPFIFAIADDETGTVLFLGKLLNVE